MVAKRGPAPPRGLGEAARRFWRSIVAVYELSPGELELLRQAVRIVDLLERMDDQLSREDLTVAGSRGQQRSHPLVYASMEQRRTLEQLMNAMALPMPTEVEGRKRSPAAVKAAQARWRPQARQHG
jgi:hypothetical protein